MASFYSFEMKFHTILKIQFKKGDFIPRNWRIGTFYNINKMTTLKKIKQLLMWYNVVMS